MFLAQMLPFARETDVSDSASARWVSEADLADLDLAPGQEHKIPLAFAGARTRMFDFEE